MAQKKFRFKIYQAKNKEVILDLLDGYHGVVIDAAWKLVHWLLGRHFLYLHHAKEGEAPRGIDRWYVLVTEQGRDVFKKIVEDYNRQNGARGAVIERSVECLVPPAKKKDRKKKVAPKKGDLL